MKIDNVYAVQSQKYLKINEKKKKETIERLSSGYKLNKAADDAAGLSISEDMKKQIRGLNRASLNSQEGITAMQIAEGALAEVHEMLNRGTELCVEAANGTLSDSERHFIQEEIDQIKSEIDAIAKKTYDNELQVLQGKTTDNAAAYKKEEIFKEVLIDPLPIFGGDEDDEDDNKDSGNKAGKISGSKSTYTVDEEKAGLIVSGAGQMISLQAGADTGEQFAITLPAISSKTIGIADVDVQNKLGAEEGILRFKTAGQYVSGERSRCGAYQNRLGHAILNVDNSAENVTAADSRANDTEMVNEQIRFVQTNLLSQAGQAILAQANHSYAGVLNLLEI